MFLETERLELRKLIEEDFDDFYAFSANAEMSRMMGRQDLTKIWAAKANFNYLKDCEERGYAIVLKQTGRMIGNFTVSDPSVFICNHPALDGYRGCSLSFSLASEYRRMGMMSEVLRAVIDHLFDEEGLDYINCGHFHFNDPSRALQEKFGFHFLCAKHIRLGDEEVDCIENILWNPKSIA